MCTAHASHCAQKTAFGRQPCPPVVLVWQAFHLLPGSPDQLFSLSEAEPHVAHAGLEVPKLLLLPLVCWDYRPELEKRPNNLLWCPPAFIITVGEKAVVSAAWSEQLGEGGVAFLRGAGNYLNAQLPQTPLLSHSEAADLGSGLGNC